VETAETKELARYAVECIVATMFDVPLEEIERFYFEPVEPDGVRVVLHLEKNQRLEHIARNPDAPACAVEVAGSRGTPERAGAPVEAPSPRQGSFSIRNGRSALGTTPKR
jgi:hypothetical protein